MSFAEKSVEVIEKVFRSPEDFFSPQEWRFLRGRNSLTLALEKDSHNTNAVIQKINDQIVIYMWGKDKNQKTAGQIISANKQLVIVNYEIPVTFSTGKMWHHNMGVYEEEQGYLQQIDGVTRYPDGNLIKIFSTPIPRYPTKKSDKYTFSSLDKRHVDDVSISLATTDEPETKVWHVSIDCVPPVLYARPDEDLRHDVQHPPFYHQLNAQLVEKLIRNKIKASINAKE